MLSWGQDSRRGFRVNDDTAADGVPVFFHPGHSVRELAASREARAFVSGDGDAFMIRGDQSDAGRTESVKHSGFSVPQCGEWMRLTVCFVTEQKQNTAVCLTERVKSSEKIRAVSCGDETVVLLSEGGNLLCVDTNQTSLVPRSEPTGLLLPGYALLPVVLLAYT